MKKTEKKSVQELYAPKSICYGCGRSNQNGLQIKSIQTENGLELWYKPNKEHQAFPGIINGGIIGTLFDCHGNWCAALTLFDSLSNSSKFPTTVTSFFSVKLLKPTPFDVTLHITAKTISVDRNKVKVEMKLFAKGELCSTGKGLFVSVKENHPGFHRW